MTIHPAVTLARLATVPDGDGFEGSADSSQPSGTPSPSDVKRRGLETSVIRDSDVSRPPLQLGQLGGGNFKEQIG